MRVEEVPWQLDSTWQDRPLRWSFAIDGENLDPIEREVASGRWSPAPALAWLLGVIRPDDRVLDLGAHIGTFALPAAALGAYVTAVEPSPRNSTLLTAARDLNGFANLDIIQRAVGETQGPLVFLDAGPVSTVDTGGLGIGGEYPTFEAEALTIDSIERPVPFDWIKIDIEGLEIQALLGASRTLASLQGLVVESNGHALHLHGAAPRDLLDTLRRAGLRVFGTAAGALVEIDPRSFQPETTVDYVAVPGRPGLPDGWTVAKPRRAWALGVALAAKRRHTVPQHRAYAARVWPDAPLLVKLPWLWASVRSGRRWRSHEALDPS